MGAETEKRERRSLLMMTNLSNTELCWVPCDTSFGSENGTRAIERKKRDYLLSTKQRSRQIFS